MPRAPIPTWFFALVVVRHRDRFLLVHERKHGQLWYLPAGRVEQGEEIAAAARRETLEEAGLQVTLDGILRVEHTPLPDGARVRVVFVAHPTDEGATLKHQPDEESLGAAWVGLEELGSYALRGEEVRELFEHVAAGGAVYPLSLLTVEGALYSTR